MYTVDGAEGVMMCYVDMAECMVGKVELMCYVDMAECMVGKV